MDQLCKTVKSELIKSFASGISHHEVIPKGSNSCTVRLEGVLVTFTVDPRNQYIGSTFEFVEAGMYREPLYGHIISKLFPEIRWNSKKDVVSVEQRISVEAGNVSRLLAEIQKQNVSPRDLLYYFLGYNAGYTDSVK